MLSSSNSLKVNLVIEIATTSGAVFFSKFAPDSGLVIDADKIGLVSEFKTRPSQIDLRTAKSSTDSSTVKIIDGIAQDGKKVFSNFLGTGLEAIIGLEIKLYVGLIDGAFDFSDYILVNKYLIRSISMAGPVYSLQCKSQTDRLQTAIYQTNGNLDSSITDVATTLDIETAEDIFQTSGRIKANNEFMQYTGKSFATGITTLTGLSRGDEAGTAIAHTAGVKIYQVEKITGNPIDILLKLILSTGDGTNGTFDTLLDGAGIPEANVKTSQFISIRDQFFPSDSFTFLFYDISNLLKYIETELLQANNLRLNEEDGLISLAILDQSVPGSDLPIVDEDVIASKPGPSWKLTDTLIINEFEMQYFYVEGTRTYNKTKIFRDADSQALYGVRKGRLLKFKGIQSDTIANDRGNRYLNRFKTPFAQISTATFLKTYKTPVGGKVNFTHSDLPKPGGGIGLNNELEILKKSIDYATAQVKPIYVFTSYRNVRRGLIAPHGDVATVIASNKVTLSSGQGALLKTGWVLQLYSSVTCLLLEPTLSEITIIDGDNITFNNNFTNLAAGTTRLRFAGYNDSSADQKARYAYIVTNSGLFADGSGGYQIF